MPLFHRKLGAGPPLVIIHGLMGSSSNWRGFAKTLADGHTVITADLRNHGRSFHADTMTVDEMGDDIIALLDELEIGAATLLGHSLGGKAAMSAALRYPGRVDSLIVADIAPVKYDSPHLTIVINGMTGLDVAKVRDRAHADDMLSEDIPDSRLRGFLLTNLVFKDGRYGWRVNLDTIINSMDDLIDFAVNPGVTYDGPALFMAGERSRYIQPEHHERIEALFPSWQLATIKGAGHWLHADQPEAFMDALKAALK
jgi:pimeloyl-ACP methyl ester carboxylesterase